MILKAIGKCIDTLPISALLSQEEAEVDVVTLEVDRFHDGTDLADFCFIMRGCTPSGGKMQQSLPKETYEDVIRLEWRIGGAFTAQAGELKLDLFACENPESPMQVIRYQLAPIQVREVPPPGEAVQNSELVYLLARIQKEADKAVERIKSIQPSLAEERLLAAENAVSQMQTATEILQQWCASMENILSGLLERINSLESTVEAIPSIVTLTADAYAAMDSPDADTLYLVTEDA